MVFQELGNGKKLRKREREREREKHTHTHTNTHRRSEIDVLRKRGNCGGSRGLELWVLAGESVHKSLDGDLFADGLSGLLLLAEEAEGRRDERLCVCVCVCVS